MDDSDNDPNRQVESKFDDVRNDINKDKYNNFFMLAYNGNC